MSGSNGCVNNFTLREGAVGLGEDVLEKGYVGFVGVCGIWSDFVAG